MLDNSLKYEHDSFFSHFWKALKYREEVLSKQKADNLWADTKCWVLEEEANFESNMF